MARLGGDSAAAGEPWRDALRLFAGSDERQGIAVSLVQLGWLAWPEDRPVPAARLYGAGRGALAERQQG